MAEKLDASYPKAVATLFKETQRGHIRKRDFTVILAFMALVEEWDEKEKEFIASLAKDKKRSLYSFAEMVRFFMATRKKLLGKIGKGRKLTSPTMPIFFLFSDFSSNSCQV
jgi:hypothetical protein